MRNTVETLKVGIIYPQKLDLQTVDILKTKDRPEYEEIKAAAYYYEVIKVFTHTILCYRLYGNFNRIFPECVNAKDYILGEFKKVQRC